MDTVASSNEVRFSTDGLPDRERLTVFREAFGRSMLKLNLSPIEGRDVRERATFWTFDKLGIVRSDTNGNIGIRTKSLLADSNDDLMFVTILSGYSFPSQLGRTLNLRPGTAAMLTAGEIARQDFPAATRFLCFRIPRCALSSRLGDPDALLMREVPASNEALRLLVDFSTMTLDGHRLHSPELRELFATHVHDLVALAVGATRDASQICRDRGLRAARFAAIKADIDKHVADERLAVGAVAERHQISARYLQMLFEMEGTTFSAHVLERRLAMAHRVLRDAKFAARSIADIALDAGFANVSYFNRAFRRRYGATPSEVRAAMPEAPK